MKLKEDLIFTLEIILPIALTISLGYALRFSSFGEEKFLKKANSFVFRVLFPIMLFVNIYQYDITQSIHPRLFAFAAISVIAIALIAALALHFTPIERAKQGVLIQTAFRSNYLIFSLAIAEKIYGEAGAAIASMMTVLVVPLFNIMAVLVILFYGTASKDAHSPGQVAKQIATNPLILGIVCGLVANLSGIRLPTVLLDTMTSIKACGTPLALLILGGSFSFKKMFQNGKEVALGILIRQVAVPFIFISLAVYVGFSGVELIPLCVIFSSSTAVSGYIMAEEGGMNGEFAGQMVVSTTFFSILSMFVVIFTLKSMGLL